MNLQSTAGNAGYASGGSGGCPFAPAPAARPAPAAGPQLDEKSAEAARTLAERGIPASQISTLLGVDEAAVKATLEGAAPSGGRQLGSNLQEKLDDLLTEDPDLCCPVSLMLFVDPVVASDGFMYEKDSIQALLRS